MREKWRAISLLMCVTIYFDERLFILLSQPRLLRQWRNYNRMRMTVAQLAFHRRIVLVTTFQATVFR